MSNTKNDIAWNKLFAQHNIPSRVVTHGYFEITAAQINVYREARLMTKFDFRSQLPRIFAENNLSILPISRGSYVISDFETFKTFESREPRPIKIQFPEYLESIDYHNISSESAALNCAFIAGIIQDFVEDEHIKATVNGRMGSSDFSFNIARQNGNLALRVRNSQLEIDGGYEGHEALHLVEAKNSISNDFLVRQLFYPYKLWSGKIKKEVRSHFLTYSNGVFHFRTYRFQNPMHYNSLVLEKEKKYVIRDVVINASFLKHVLDSSEMEQEPEVPFPQADSFDRLINLCELLHKNKELTRTQITSNYDFDVRQTNYYTDAGRYLGLISKSRKEGEVVYTLSGKGISLFKLGINERQVVFIKSILARRVFSRVLKDFLAQGKVANNHAIVAVMKQAKLYKINSNSTYYRRASTVAGWINWIVKQMEQ